MRLRVVGLVVFVSLAFAGPARAVTLVYPNGKPVGGRWQRWANEAKVPTVRGHVVLAPASICYVSTAPVQVGNACSGPLGAGWEVHASDRASLYFELGHIFDWSRLTWTERRHLAHIWRATGHHWLDSLHSLDLGVEDGLEIDFAAIYGLCAQGIPRAPQGLASGIAPAITLSPPAATCDYIRGH